ncbi:hypothetical protein L226DRAFT_572664 [Lentinus tigrinus ALCF2SS1-7]|uniref:uncharacterized protein n=1 Tax=Lentinus tigrinus ALCF2SS1-7 TaxID=1328758 RepID=UPI001165EB88|nr:hypothetical protein L226DRAFT_572664 [Lentinus tigrinus ALCF2SS1-7]
MICPRPTKLYIRTATEVRPEWLLEYAPAYFNPSTFTDVETKRALLRTLKSIDGVISRVLKIPISPSSLMGRKYSLGFLLYSAVAAPIFSDIAQGV